MEVFPYARLFAKTGTSFLHIRGGVSQNSGHFGFTQQFSPHTWRCFPAKDLGLSHFFVFSTYVEVFLPVFVDEVLPGGFLHIRGGVSLLKMHTEH